ncbi:MAG: Flp pilus assembly protein CpaB [Acidimicrobiales bacterium]
MTKRATFMVVIGIVVFAIGFVVVLASLGGHHPVSTTSSNASGTPVVVATKALPAGMSGETIIGDSDVALKTVSSSLYRSDDLTSVSSLSQEALNLGVPAGYPVEASNLHLDVGPVAPPSGDESLALTFPTGASGLAGYLAPGSYVDVYATVTQATLAAGGTSTKAQLPVPCTALVQSQVLVLDVSNEVAPYRASTSGAGRSVPSNMTVLVAVTPQQAVSLVFYSTNAQIYMAQTTKGGPAADVTTCSAVLGSPILTPVP